MRYICGHLCNYVQCLCSIHFDYEFKWLASTNEFSMFDASRNVSGGWCMRPMAAYPDLCCPSVRVSPHSGSLHLLQYRVCRDCDGGGWGQNELSLHLLYARTRCDFEHRRKPSLHYVHFQSRNMSWFIHRHKTVTGACRCPT